MTHLPDTIGRDTLTVLGARWWAFALRGAAAILFGALTLLWPNLTLTAVLTAYGVFLIADGLLAILAGVASLDSAIKSWWLLVVGAVGVVCGAATVLWPAVALVAFLYLVASWLLAVGLLLILAAIQIRREIDSEWILGALGAVSILLGVALLLFPQAGSLVITWVLASYALISGSLLLAFALRVRSAHLAR